MSWTDQLRIGAKAARELAEDYMLQAHEYSTNRNDKEALRSFAEAKKAADRADWYKERLPS